MPVLRATILSRSRVVFFVFMFGFVGRSSESATLEQLVEPTAHSLRNETIDLGDAWSSARLLAHFGETRLAYDVLHVSGVADEPMGRFEARLLVEMGLVERADSVLALQPLSPEEPQYYTLCLWRSRLSFLAGNYDRALWFLSLLDTLSAPAFEPYKDYLTLDCLNQAGRFDEACVVAEARLARGIPLSLSPQFEERLLDAYVTSGHNDKALHFIDVLKARRGRSPAIAPVLVREVLIRFAIGDSAGATSRAVELIHDRRTRARASSVAKSVIDRVEVAKLSDSQLLVFLRAVLDNDQLADADRLASVLSTRRLTPGQEEERALLAAELYFEEKRYSKAFALVQRRFADASLERKASLLRARIARKTGGAEQSANDYVAFAKSYPYDVKAAEALLVASEIYFDLGQKQRSMELLELIRKTYPSSRHARTATMRIAGYHLDRRDFTEGIRILSEAVTRTQRDEELLYYLGEAYRRAGDAVASERIFAELRELDATSFYVDPSVDLTFSKPLMGSNGRVELRGDAGLLVFLERVFRDRLLSYEHVRAALDKLAVTNARLDASELYLERGRQFLQMGFRDWAEYELKILESNYTLPARYSFELGMLYDDFAMHWRSVRAFQRVLWAMPLDARAAVEKDFELLLHPIPYPALVLENCSRNRVPPHLAYAMMRQESHFDLNAVSTAGAMGLMQLMPATGDQVAGQLGFPQGEQESLFVPEINLTFGIWYASHLLSRTNGDAVMMLSAYNAGLGNAKRWFRGTRSDGGGSAGRTAIAAVDGIDFSETRNYVKKIVESARTYRAFYFDTDAESLHPER